MLRQTQIKMAYRKLSKIPPRYQQGAWCWGKYKEVQAAYETLRTTKRAASRHILRCWKGEPTVLRRWWFLAVSNGRWLGSFADIFSSFFGGGAGRFTQSKCFSSRDDFQYRVNLTLKKLAIFELKKKLSIIEKLAVVHVMALVLKPGTSPVTLLWTLSAVLPRCH